MIVSTQQNLGTDLDIGGSDAPPRNWRGIGLAVLVITIVMSLVLLSIFLLSPEDPKQPVKPFLTLSDLETMEYQVHVPTLSWASDTEIILKTRDGNLIQQNVKTKEFRILLRNTTLVSLRASNAELSPDLQNILLIFNKQQISGVAAKASYSIYNIRTSEVWDLKPPGKNETSLQYASWGPHGSQVVFIFQNDIYYQQSASAPALRLTSSGDPETVLNGITDWTYQEEVLHSYAAHWWSPDGTRLAYLSINNTLVPKMELTYFLGSDYPASRKYAYPKVCHFIFSCIQLFIFFLVSNTPCLELSF
ncbi:inactive dipeptidyl peptidase 10-like [Xenopus tropicalis]|uniref:Inactive dipeptidyl peptidase 10-like n=1 Tax=Xenopus tropicalis TaxID=8364 RepID=A0A8J1J8M7_XENTR|nr:inactive dipeptidyl peptidase 10-like [Xenopus tropicalis]